MVFFNYATMQMAAKIVYYGPGLCGKTTNLQHIYNKTSANSRGEMVSLETETDRTLFFDLLPIEAGVIGGFKTRLQLYTVPGQVFYNTTRKLVLKGADGIVFVADSQEPMLEANVQSMRNLHTNIEELGMSLEELPLVVQLNKRDLPNIVSTEILASKLNPDGKRPVLEASAVHGEGVFETLKMISKLTLKGLRSRMTGEEEKPSGAQFVVHTAPTTSPGTAPHADLDPKRTVSVPNPLAEMPADSVEESGATTGQIDQVAESSVDDSREPTQPGTEPSAADQEEPAEAEAAEEATPVKRVKVRSTVDIMAELEVLRRSATGKSKEPEDLSPQRRDLHKTIHLEPGSVERDSIRGVSIVIELQDGEQNVLKTETKRYELTPEEIRKLIVSLNVDLS